MVPSSTDGTRIRERRKRRIREPVHSQLLLWLDQWRADDFVLRMGVKITKQGLVATKR